MKSTTFRYSHSYLWQLDITFLRVIFCPIKVHVACPHLFPKCILISLAEACARIFLLPPIDRCASLKAANKQTPHCASRTASFRTLSQNQAAMFSQSDILKL